MILRFTGPCSGCCARRGNGTEKFGSGERVAASIGISLCPDDGGTVAALLRNADADMYRAKEEGGNAYQFYTPEMTSSCPRDSLALPSNPA